MHMHMHMAHVMHMHAHGWLSNPGHSIDVCTEHGPSGTVTKHDGT